MKFSTTTAALIATTTTIVGSVSALKAEFSTPIAFTQYQDDCDGTKLYEGLIDKVTKLDVGSFCVVDTITSEDGLTSETAYSKLDVVSCNTDKIYDHWSKCTDDMCTDCTMEYRSFTAWDSHSPEDMMSHCYVYNFSMDDHTTVKDSRNAPLGVTVGTFDDIMTVAYNFDATDNEDDVAAYMSFVKDNSCIADGPPTEDPAGTDQDTDLSVSAGNAVAFSTAALVMTFAASMMLA